MVACAEFLGRDQSTCTRGISCVCKREAEAAKSNLDQKLIWIECVVCNGYGVIREYEDSSPCHSCEGEGGYYVSD